MVLKLRNMIIYYFVGPDIIFMCPSAKKKNNILFYSVNIRTKNMPNDIVSYTILISYLGLQ